MAHFQMLALIMLLSSAGSASAAHANEEVGSIAAVQKVIQMLIDMSATAKQEKMDEEVAFAKFNTFCTEEQASLKGKIAKEVEDINLLSAEIEKLSSDVKTLGEQITKLASDVEAYTANQKEQTAQREKEHEAFLAEQADYAESLDALDRAVQKLQKQNYDRPGTQAALLQLSQGESLPAQAKAMVAALIGMMQAPDEDDSSGFMSRTAPEANAYEFQSGNIIDLLKKLTDDFRAKKGQCEKEEANSQHAFDMVMTDLTNSIRDAKQQIGQKTTLKESKAARSAEAKEQLASTLQCKAEDEKTLSDLSAECSQKKLSFEEKQQLRADEIEAIEQAVEILSGEAVSGNAEKHLALAATSLVQLGSTSSSNLELRGVHRRVREFLTSEATRLHSPRLQLLAQKMASDPFAKVKKLIDDMITRLLEEANADAEKEGWCDKELGQSQVTRDRLSAEIDGLTAAVEAGKATIVTLSDEIASLTTDVADLEKAMAEATSLRTAEKAKNTATVKDAEAGMAAVESATAVLKAFYEKALSATALLQLSSVPRRGSLLARGIEMGTEEWKALANPAYETGTATGAMVYDPVTGVASAPKKVDKGHKEGMQTFGEQYQGQQDAAGGVLALLESILADFGNVKADTEAAEAASQHAFEEFMTEGKKNCATKRKKIEMDTADKAKAEAKLRQDIADLKSTQDELLAADRYHAKLVPQCIDQGMTWEERVKARESEIASLKEALALLSSADIETSAL